MITSFFSLLNYLILSNINYCGIYFWHYDNLILQNIIFTHFAGCIFMLSFFFFFGKKIVLNSLASVYFSMKVNTNRSY